MSVAYFCVGGVVRILYWSKTSSNDLRFFITNHPGTATPRGHARRRPRSITTVAPMMATPIRTPKRASNPSNHAVTSNWSATNSASVNAAAGAVKPSMFAATLVNRRLGFRRRIPPGMPMIVPMTDASMFGSSDRMRSSAPSPCIQRAGVIPKRKVPLSKHGEPAQMEWLPASAGSRYSLLLNRANKARLSAHAKHHQVAIGRPTLYHRQPEPLGGSAAWAYPSLPPFGVKEYVLHSLQQDKL